MEAYVLPFASLLVARPHADITLGACPAVEGDDEGTGLMAIIGHDMSHIGNAVESERIAGTHPRHICLQHSHTSIAYLFYYITLQQGGNRINRM